MANNYLQFSFEIPTTPEQQTWLDAKMGEMFDLPDDPPDDFEANDYQDSGASFALEHYDYSTVIYSEEYGNTDHLADFLQAYLKHFDINEPIGVEWAMTCSKMRTNEFSGGACVIWKNEIEWMGTSSWIDETAGSSTLNIG